MGIKICTGKETEAQKGQGTSCPRSHSRQAAEVETSGDSELQGRLSLSNPQIQMSFILESPLEVTNRTLSMLC